MIKEEKKLKEQQQHESVARDWSECFATKLKIIIKSFSSETFIRLKEAECCANERDEAVQAISIITKASFRKMKHKHYCTYFLPYGI